MLARLIKRARDLELPVKLGALKESQSNEFYLRHGFVPHSEGEWDIYYVRPVDRGPIKENEVRHRT